MADYTGVPSVRPRPDAGVPVDRTEPTAAAAMKGFGGKVIQLGETAQALGERYDQVAADDVFNQFSSEVTRMMHGDPSASGPPGPDGKPVRDVGFMGTNGRAALDAAPEIDKKLTKLQRTYSGKLKSPVAQAAFNTAAGKLVTASKGQIANHSNAQQTVWFKTVNDVSASNALNLIAANPDNPDIILNASAELTNAYVKQAELDGAQPGDEVWNDAIRRGKKDSVVARIGTIATTEPDRALAIAEAERDLLGTDYDAVYGALRARADEAAGNSAADAAFAGSEVSFEEKQASSPTNPAAPIYQQTTTAIPGAYSPSGLARLIQIESGGRADAVSPSGKHHGAAQFGEPAWKDYGAGGDPNNFDDSVRAAQRMGIAATKMLTPVLGRPPTDAELYIAHQQGAGGAKKLLTNPNATAASLIGIEAVKGNLPKNLRAQAATMTAAEFVGYWTHRFNKTMPAGAGPAPPAGRFMDLSQSPGDSAVPSAAAPASAEVADPTSVEAPPTPEGVDPMRLGAEADDRAIAQAEAYQSIFDNTELSADAKQHAISALNQRFAAEKILLDAQETAKKTAQQETINKYATAILTGQTDGLLNQIATDPTLDGADKLTLTNAFEAHVAGTATGVTATYGDSYYKVLNQVLADPGDPSRIADNTTVLRMAADPSSGLTLQGANSIIQQMALVKKSPDAQAAANAKVGLLTYAKSKLSFETMVGNYRIPDPQGEAIFNARFVPQFEAAYAKWVEKGNDPFEFLTQENVDKIAAGLRSPREMAMSELLAHSAGVDVSQLPEVPTPAGVDPTGWKLVVYTPTVKADGTPRAPDQWMAAVQALVSDPTPEKQQQFDAYFSNTGITAADLLEVLTPEGGDLASAMPPAPAGGDPGLALPGTAPNQPDENAKRMIDVAKAQIARGLDPGDVAAGLRTNGVDESFWPDELKGK